MTYEQAREAREQIEQRYLELQDRVPGVFIPEYLPETERGKALDALSASLARAIHVEYRALR